MILNFLKAQNVRKKEQKLNCKRFVNRYENFSNKKQPTNKTYILLLTNETEIFCFSQFDDI